MVHRRAAGRKSHDRQSPPDTAAAFATSYFSTGVVHERADPAELRPIDCGAIPAILV
jgi:hypothetical protein